MFRPRTRSCLIAAVTTRLFCWMSRQITKLMYLPFGGRPISSPNLSHLLANNTRLCLCPSLGDGVRMALPPQEQGQPLPRYEAATGLERALAEVLAASPQCQLLKRSLRRKAD